MTEINAHNTDILIDAEFKDSSPIKTVEHIKEILKNNDIEVTEAWNESGVPYCYSMRLTVNGTSFGVNGKGLTKEFAMASAYGELMERLQFGFIGNLGVQKNASFSNRERKYTVISAAEHLSENISWYEALAKRYLDFTGTQLDPYSLLDRHTDKDGNINTAEYYNISKKEPSHFPIGLSSIYTTNGVAAGNTVEEAIVQAISETVERHNHIQILHESLTLPEIPDNILKKYKTAYEIITYVRNQGFKVMIKDASMGLKFPVVCAVFVQISTGKYHTHFGAFPIFEIALERALTETFQGRNLSNIAGFDDFHYDAKKAYSAQAITAELVTGTAEKLVDFFSGTAKNSFNENMGFDGGNNLALMKECVEYFRQLGYEILVRDRSCLGFPALQVIIPGYSEWAIHRLTSEGDDNAYMPHFIRVMRNPTAANDEDFIKFAEYKKLSKEYNSLRKNSKDSFKSLSLLSVKIPAYLDEQLLHGTKAYAAYQVADYETAARHLNQILPLKSGTTAEKLICLKRYLMMKANGYSQDQIMQMIRYFHTSQTETWLLENTKPNKNPFDMFVLRCDEKCNSGCILFGLCNQKQTQNLTDLIINKISALSFEESVQKFKKLGL